jgi:hypothetical protein
MFEVYVLINGEQTIKSMNDIFYTVSLTAVD